MNARCRKKALTKHLAGRPLTPRERAYVKQLEAVVLRAMVRAVYERIIPELAAEIGRAVAAFRQAASAFQQSVVAFQDARRAGLLPVEPYHVYDPAEVIAAARHAQEDKGPH